VAKPRVKTRPCCPSRPALPTFHTVREGDAVRPLRGTVVKGSAAFRYQRLKSGSPGTPSSAWSARLAIVEQTKIELSMVERMFGGRDETLGKTGRSR